ncbi:MAG: hypothetical protein C0445_01750 [Polaromonas sp.]|nr:hypothetical protein [Polaromonas sp.]
MNPTRRFVPTLTDVVRPEELMAHSVVTQPPSSPAPTPVLDEDRVWSGAPVGAEPPPSPHDTAAWVAKVCETVHQTLDDHLRTMVMQQVQAQQLLLIQSLRAELLPLVQPMVQEAVQAALQQRSPTPE